MVCFSYGVSSTFFVATPLRTVRNLAVKASVKFVSGICLSIWKQKNMEV